MEEACEEKARLLRSYLFAVSDYSRAVRVLHEKLGTIPKQDYEKIRSFVEQARESVERARGALDKHTAEHDC